MKRLIFVHGGPGFSDYLEQFFANEFSKNVETTFYTQLSKRDAHLKDFVSQLSKMIRPQDSEVYLIGHSWGGVLSLEFLHSQADSKVKGLVLMDSYLCSAHAEAEYEMQLKDAGITNPTWEQIFLSSQEKLEGQQLLDELKKTFDERTFKSLEGYLKSFDLRDFFQNLNLPVLNIFGDSDMRIPPRVMQTFSALNPQVKNVEIKGAGHFPFILAKNKDKIVEAIQAFIGAN